VTDLGRSSEGVGGSGLGAGAGGETAAVAMEMDRGRRRTADGGRPPAGSATLASRRG
jgi:hypothetical protein